MTTLPLSAFAFSPRPEISHVIFDFDGTLSWLRHGWPQLMLEVFRPYYPARPSETEQEIHNLLITEILSLNGRQSIFQMIRFRERVRERAGDCPSAEELLQQYQSRLDRTIALRSHEIQCGEARVDDYVVHGARPFLEKMRGRGLRLIILSGTIEHRVREEAALLGLAGYFDPHIYGANSGPGPFSKKLVIDRLLREKAISGRQLLSFGDGPVEIQETKRVGGLAIGVASNEEINGGTPDPWKHAQLLEAGADAVVADFSRGDALLSAIFGDAKD